MHVDKAFMSLVDNKSEGVVIRIRLLTLFTGKKARPRLQITLIKSIGSRTDLEYYGVEIETLQAIE